MNQHCPGCGAAFQRDQPEKPGYLPLDFTSTGGTVCRRCYRLRHYGRGEGRALSPAGARKQVARAVEAAEAVVVVTDVADFDGGLPPAGLLPTDKPVLLVVNKMDLLPPKAVPREVVAWARLRWRELGQRPEIRTAIAVSAAKGMGLAELRVAMQRYAGHRQVLAIVGATSVGKSTLMRRLLPREAETPTISRFPGTTTAATRWHLERTDLTVYDTPGFLPGDRLGDLLCPSCAARLVPERTLASKLFGIDPGQSVVFGGFAAFTLTEGEPRTFLAYASDQVVLHRTTVTKAEELLASRPEWLLPWACTTCRPAPPYRSQTATLAAGEDLAVAGLGWISLRGGSAAIDVRCPDGVRVLRRPAIFGPRSGQRSGARASAKGPQS